jgi:NitT/TauT family transport system substrate-binding protein
MAELKTRTLLIGQASETTFWPWLKAKYGFTDAQKRPYAFSVQQFLVDKNVAQQGYATSEPYSIEKAGVKPTVFLLADAGYPPYAQTIVTTQAIARESRDGGRFLQATAEGKSYRASGPNASSRKVNPQMRRAARVRLAKMREYALGAPPIRDPGSLTRAEADATSWRGRAGEPLSTIARLADLLKAVKV